MSIIGTLPMRWLPGFLAFAVLFLCCSVSCLHKDRYTYPSIKQEIEKPKDLLQAAGTSAEEVEKLMATPLEQTYRVVRDFGAYLREVLEVENFVSYTGTASPMDFNGMVRHYYLGEGGNLAEKELRDRLLASESPLVVPVTFYALRSKQNRHLGDVGDFGE